MTIPLTGRKALHSVDSNRGWWPIIRESFSGAWQQNAEVNVNSVLSYNAVFACQTLIASDIAKLRLKLVKRDSDDIWTEVQNPAYSPVLRKPNAWQNRIQFFECWVLSKLQRGNAYILKERDQRGVVTRLHVLDPTHVTPLVADDGSVFYELRSDLLAGIDEAVRVPAREIIHDRFNCFYHPLVGLSPIFANGLAATNGLAIQSQATRFFQNGSSPGGVLTAPGAISDETAARLKEHWETNYTGANIGKIAVLGDGLKYEPMAVKATDAQLIEQLKWSADVVCSTYHVPPYKIGLGQMPSYNNIQALNTEYYSQCLQILIESIELCIDEGLGMADGVGVEFDIDNLLRMDSVTQVNALKEAVSAGIMAPNEARSKLGLGAVEGGSAPYLQQQNYSLEALARRDAQEDPFAARSSVPDAPAAEDETQAEEDRAANDNMAEEAAKALATIYKGLR
ncbi:phage portal protein [Acuticoccus sediminis]|uniref:phage portal protein n=1 Tax=Acuticoccus sediminis TaxID=2184697 RepID=UPI001CFDD789|nr:phage portal protein [Acuticoccus sediminis]